MLDRHRFFGAAPRLEINVTHAHEFRGDGVHHAEFRLVRRHGHRAADVLDRSTLAAVDKLVRRRNRFHVERTHQGAATDLFVDEVIRIATAHERHEKHRVKTGHDLGGAPRKKDHRQIDSRLESRHLLRKREISKIRATHQEKVRTVFRSQGTGLHECSLVRSIGIQEHRKKCTAFFNFSIQAEFSLSWFHKKSFLPQVVTFKRYKKRRRAVTRLPLPPLLLLIHSKESTQKSTRRINLSMKIRIFRSYTSHNASTTFNFSHTGQKRSKHRYHSR